MQKINISSFVEHTYLIDEGKLHMKKMGDNCSFITYRQCLKEIESLKINKGKWNDTKKKN